MNKRDLVTAERLRRLYFYCPYSGDFIRRTEANSKVRIGQKVGHVGKDGYTLITIDQRDYPASNLAWLYTYGDWPKDVIDHIDRNKRNDAIDNLRAATRAQNACNTKLHKHNTSGFRGVRWFKPMNMWAARIVHRGQEYSLGYFYTAEAAARAYAKKAKELHGQFAAKQGVVNV